MKLVLLYVPPAAGKLSVAGHLATLSGFKVFHNHSSIDLAETIFERGTPAFGRTVTGVRRLVFEEAARGGVSLIFTYVYAHPHDAGEMAWMIRAVEENGGEVELVHLTCTPEALKARVGEAPRKSFRKITSVEVLTGLLERYDLFSPYAERESLHFDTTVQPADAVSRAIRDRLGLGKAQ